MTIKLKDISKTLNSALEARMIVKHITGLSDADIITADDIPLTDDQQSQLDDMVRQRLNGRPVSKIIGVKEFYGRDFIVSDDVLDPRPDSETLIETILRHCEGASRPRQSKGGKQNLSWIASSPTAPRNDDSIKILDLGTGSGCLILTLLAEMPNAHGVATDISDAALAIAKQNAEKIGVADRVDFIKSDWFESVVGEFDMIVSNPPYIESDHIPHLDKNVREFDPIGALDGGADGLGPYKVILPQIRNHLKQGGMVALEHGVGQCGRIEEIACTYGLSPSRVVHDLGGRDRVFFYIHK